MKRSRTSSGRRGAFSTTCYHAHTHAHVRCIRVSSPSHTAQAEHQPTEAANLFHVVLSKVTVPSSVSVHHRLHGLRFGHSHESGDLLEPILAYPHTRARMSHTQRCMREIQGPCTRCWVCILRWQQPAHGAPAPRLQRPTRCTSTHTSALRSVRCCCTRRMASPGPFRAAIRKGAPTGAVGGFMEVHGMRCEPPSQCFQKQSNPPPPRRLR